MTELGFAPYKTNIISRDKVHEVIIFLVFKHTLAIFVLKRFLGGALIGHFFSKVLFPLK